MINNYFKVLTTRLNRLVKGLPPTPGELSSPVRVHTGWVVGGITGLLVLLIVLVQFSGGYNVEYITKLAINCMIVSSFYFITLMGRVSFVHAQIVGFGGYTAAILVTRLDWPFWPSLLLGGLAASLVGLLISYPIMRTKGFYFFMCTFVCGSILIWIFTQVINPFGGAAGITGVLRPREISFLGIFDVNLANRNTYAYLTIAIALISLFILYRLQKGRLGTILRSISYQEPLAISIGLSVRKYETIGFCIACFIAGLAGVLMVHLSGVAHSSDYGSNFGMSIVTYSVVGGMGQFAGPLIGLTVLTYISQLIMTYQEYIPLIYGVILVLTILFLPGGLISLPKVLSRLFRRIFNGTSVQHDKVRSNSVFRD